MLLEVQDLTSLWICRCWLTVWASQVVFRGVGSYHTNIWSATAFEHFCESDGPPQTSQSVPPTVGLNSQSLWGVSLQYLDFKYSMFLMPLSVLYIYMGNCLPVSTSSCFKLAYNRTSVVTQARSQVSELMVPTATQMIWTQWSVDGGSNGISFGKCALLPSYPSSDQRIYTSPPCPQQIRVWVTLESAQRQDWKQGFPPIHSILKA